MGREAADRSQHYQSGWPNLRRGDAPTADRPAGATPAPAGAAGSGRQWVAAQAVRRSCKYSAHAREASERAAPRPINWRAIPLFLLLRCSSAK